MTRFKRVIAVALAAIVLTAVAAVPAYATNYFNCTGGVACIWINKDGGGSKLTISVGQFGYNQCWSMAGIGGDNQTSSASADFGGGWDLRLYAGGTCSDSAFSRYDVESSEFVNFTGINSWFNDAASSFKIMQT